MKSNLTRARQVSRTAVILCLTAATAFCAEDVPEQSGPFKHQVTGLFSKDREKDLRVTFEQMPDFELVSIDFEKAEIVLDYDPAEAFSGTVADATPEQIVERLDQLLGQASRRTFGIKPLCTIPRQELELVEIPVVGLDCKGCCLAAYEAIYRIDGVQQATASFKQGWVTAWIDPEKTDSDALKEALKNKGVNLQAP